MFMEVLIGFAIQTQLVASGLPGPFGGVGWWGVVFTSFFHLSRRYQELFSPITSRTARHFLFWGQKGNKFDNSMICFPFLCQLSAPDVLFPGAPACTWNCMAPSCPFLRHFGAPDVFFPGAPTCTWNCMAHLSSISPSIWCPWRFLPWNPCLHLKLHGTPLVLFSVNLAAPLTFSSLDPLLALETAWHPLVLFSVNLAPWRFLSWIPYLHLQLHGAPLVLFSINLAPLTFSSLEPLLSLETCMAHLSSFFSVNLAPLMFSSLEHLLSFETAWPPSRPFLRQFGAPDVFFPGAPACTWNSMAPLSSYWFNFLSFFFLFLATSFFPFFFLIPFFSSFFLFSPLFLSFSFLFSFFLAPLWWPRGAQAPKAPPPKIRPWI